MKLRTILAATAAVSLAASPALAQSTFAPVAAESESELEGGSGIIIAILAAAAIIAGIVILADNGDDAPTSP